MTQLHPEETMEQTTNDPLPHGETMEQETTYLPCTEMMVVEQIVGWNIVVDVRDVDRVLHVLVFGVGGDCSVILATTVLPILLKLYP